MGSHDGVVSGCSAEWRQGDSKNDPGIGSPTLPESYSLFSQPLSPPAVSRGRLSSCPFLLYSHVPLLLFTGPPAIRAQLSSLASTSPFISFTSQWIEDAPPKNTTEQQRRTAGCREPMKRKMSDSKRKTSPARDIKRTNRRPWISVRTLLGVRALSGQRLAGVKALLASESFWGQSPFWSEPFWCQSPLWSAPFWVSVPFWCQCPSGVKALVVSEPFWVSALFWCQSPSGISGLLVTIMCFGPGILPYSPTKNEGCLGVSLTS